MEVLSENLQFAKRNSMHKVSSIVTLWRLCFIYVALFQSRGWDFINVIGDSQFYFSVNDPNFNYTYSSLFYSWTGATQYGVGIWTKRGTYDDTDWYSVFEISNDASTSLYDGRVVVMVMSQDPSYQNEWIYHMGSPQDGYGNYIPSADSAANNYWGVILFTDPVSGIQNIYQYQNWLPRSDQIYSLNQNTYFQIGGGCICNITRVRLFTGIFINQTAMLSLFAEEFPSLSLDLNMAPGVSQTQTLQMTSNTLNLTNAVASSAYLGFSSSIESADPGIGSYFISCNGNQIIAYPNGPSSYGAFTVIFWFRLKNEGGDQQTLFSMQDSSSATWDFALEYISSTNSISVVQQSPAFANFTLPLPTSPQTWNHLIFNSYYNEPNNTNTFCYNVSLNGNSSWLFDCQNQIKNISSPTLYLCAKPNSLSSQESLINGAAIDITHFTFIAGHGAISPSATLPGCMKEVLSGISNNNGNYSCILCQNNYHLFGGACESTCPTDYTAQTDTRCCYNTVPLCFDNQSAIAGTLSITPSSGGIPLSTSFVLNIQGWTPINFSPLFLTYEVSALELTGTTTLISDFSSQTQYTFVLPIAVPQTVQVTIEDQRGCTTVTSIDVSFDLSNPTTLLNAATSFASSNLGNASTDVNAIINQVTAVNQLLVCNNINSNSATTPSTCDPSQSVNCSSAADCSNQGACNSEKCICNSGYFLSDCSLDQATYNLQNQNRQQILNMVLSTISSSDFNMNNLSSLLSLMNTLTQVPTLNSNQTLSAALNGLNQAMQLMNSSLNSNSGAPFNLSSAIQETADIISDAFNQIIEMDCGIWNNFSSQALNDSFYLLQNLSFIALKNAGSACDYPQITISTPLFSMLSGIYNESQLNDLEISAGGSSPQIQLGTLNNSQASPSTIALNYIYLNRNPLSCSSTPPATNFTLQFYTVSSWQPVSLNIPITITYPQKIFGVVVCAGGCSQLQDSSTGNAVCYCQNISIFDFKNQLGRLYQESNLNLLTLSNIALLLKAPLYLEWSFWVSVAVIIWLIITLIVVKTCNKNYCITSYLKKNVRTVSGCVRFFIFTAVMHPFFNIYFYRGSKTSKVSRALIYFGRVMALLGTSAIFMNNTGEVTFVGELASSDIYLMLAPLFLIIPITFVIKLLLRDSDPSSRRRPKRLSNNRRELPGESPAKPSVDNKIKKSIGVILTILLALGGVIAALTISIQISSIQKLSWAAKFTKSILQDLFISPLIIMLLNYLLVKFEMKTSRRNVRLRKFITTCADNAMIRLLHIGRKNAITSPPPNNNLALTQSRHIRPPERSISQNESRIDLGSSQHSQLRPPEQMLHQHQHVIRRKTLGTSRPRISHQYDQNHDYNSESQRIPPEGTHRIHNIFDPLSSGNNNSRLLRRTLR